MNLTDGQFLQLIIALGGGLLLFVFCQMGGDRTMFQVLVATLPFQLIDSRYGTLNVGMAYVVAVSTLLRRHRHRLPRPELFPVLLALGLVALAYAVSLVMHPRPLTTLKLAYLFSLGSNLALASLVLTFVREEADLHRLFGLLLACNLLVIAYCALQVFAGFTRIVPFGIQEFAMVQNRANMGMGGEERRLMGPFSGPGVMAEYLVVMVYLLAYWRLTTGRHPRLIAAVVFLDLCVLVGTGNRGGLLVLLGGFGLFCALFRNHFRAGRILLLGVAGALLLAGASLVMLRFTQFNVLYDRLARTEVQDGVPDTRARWPVYIEEGLALSPWAGTGVRLALPGDFVTASGAPKSPPPGTLIRGYPHSLYIYIFYTLGLFGLAAYAALFLGVLLVITRTRHAPGASAFLQGLPRLGVLTLALIAVDQLKIEMLRHNFTDYQHFVTVVVTLFLAAVAVQRQAGQGVAPDA